MEQRVKVTLSQVHHYLKIDCVQRSSNNTYQGLPKVFLFLLQPLLPASVERLPSSGRNETGKNMLIERKRIRTKFSEQGVLHVTGRILPRIQHVPTPFCVVGFHIRH